MKNERNKKLRELLNSPEIIRAVGAGDPWTAKLIEQAGFPVVYMSGYFASHINIGKSDIGLMTQTEMVNVARNIASSVSVPVIADADTGFGGILNLVRTVKEYENAGVSAIQLEDQVFPKRCGHMEGKSLIPVEEMVAKIRAAVDTRQDPDFVIIARTDARAVTGFEDAIFRAQEYVKAGADVIFLEAPQSESEMIELNSVIERPTLANMVYGGKTPLFTGKRLEEMGYSIVIYPIALLQVYSSACFDYLKNLKQSDESSTYSAHMLDFNTINATAGLNIDREYELSFSAKEV